MPETESVDRPCVASDASVTVNYESGEGESAYEVRKNDLFGRYVVATRDLSPGDLVLREPAYVFGPKQNSLPCCLGCTLPLEDEEDVHRCSKCQYPLCSSECEQRPEHQVECPVLAAGGAKARPVVEDFTKPAAYLEAVTVVRLLKLRDTDPARFERVMEMDSSPEHWPKSELSGVFQHNVVNFLRTVCKVNADEQLLQRLGGILMTNAFEARGRRLGSHVRCLFPEAGLLAHSCLPNVHHTIDHNFTIFLRAAEPVKKGAILFTSYTHCLSGTLSRRLHLKHSKFFDCGCTRCADPTELGTNFSALRCCRCTKGCILPRDSLDAQSEWTCVECGYEVHPDNVRKLNTMLLHELDSLDNSDFIEHEMFIRKYSSLLHPNHYIIFDAKHRLSQMYGRTGDYQLQELTELHLKRKIELCRDVLQLATRTAPGIARLTGLTYYELHAPLMVLAQRQYARGAISRTEMEALLDEASDNLEKAIGMLKYEPELSLEGKIHASALRSREELAALRGTVVDLPETGRGHLTPAHIDELVGEFNAVLELMDDYQWRV
ncbi:SET domain-containing protein SmydA-8-like [Amphibalanus amphitrite]|uniref:SET domain-containing protein SmydA-8-like n=1 Tax=Amphibalanus amphitrite TaxID=1232801 RepID=UPI001C9114C7|nr:SET domain-containing protein SmydA-8-like [Amphibalanus amphitrite]